MSLLGISKKGKWIVGGVALFAVIATASTGLAAWVLGSAKTGTAEGNIVVSDVNDVNCTVTMKTDADLSVNFGPCLVDSTTPADHVISPSGDTTEEDLEFTIAGTLSSANYPSVEVFISEAGIKTYVDDGYIVMPTGFTYDETGKGWKATINVTTEGSGETATYKFSETYKFTWGTKSGSKNPVNHFTNYDEAKTYLDGLNGLKGTKISITVTPKTANA